MEMAKEASFYIAPFVEKAKMMYAS
jgi:hypothetical protein